MGAESSVQRDGKEEEDAPSSSSAPSAATVPVSDLQDTKPLQKNGQISSMTSLNGHSEDNTLAEVGQPDGVSVAQKEDASETMETIQDEVTPQVNGEKVEKEASEANDISTVEEKAAEEKPEDANEVGFKKIFRFVGFKFTLKKDKSEEKDPVKLLTVKDKEGEEVSGTDEPVKEVEEEAATAEEKSSTEEKEVDTEASTAEADVTKDETTDAPAEEVTAETKEEEAKEEGTEKEDETTPPSQETTLSPFRKFFSGGLFSNLRKKASIKKTKEELENEAAEEEAAKLEEEKEEKGASEEETKEEVLETPVEEKSEPKEEAPSSSGEAKSEAAPETEAPATTEAATDEPKQEESKAEASGEEEKASAEVTSEAELLSSQEKAKPLGSPLKKLFTGAGLKKLSTKKQKSKKDAEAKVTESGEQTAEQLQSSTESTEPPKAESGPSSPEESGEHAIAAEAQNESSQETEGEVTSDGEKKKEGIIAWSSFKKLVTPKKRVKRSSESEDEAGGDKPAKSATLSSSESAPLADKSVEEEAKEEKPAEEEPKTENTEKLVSSTEEPKKKMDTSVSWEALMCMGGPKKRTRKTSDSEDEETKIEEEVPAGAEGEQEEKTEAAIATSLNTESEVEPVSSPEPMSPPERESTWDTLKRIVMPKSKSRSEEKPEEPADQVLSDSDVPKDESSFSLRKFFPGRRKKKLEKQSSSDLGSGEEDSDTPAVVPLSEYEKQEESEPEAPEEAPEAQPTVSDAEDRSPSWIPATVEDADDKHDQLSDIPEVEENAATPKSIDTDLTEEEDQAAFLKAAGRKGRRLSTAEVKPVAPTPDGETTPVPQGPKSESAEEVMEPIDAQINEVPCLTSVTVQDLPVEIASEKMEYEPQTENAKSVTNTILEPHLREEAMAICTGLGTKEIAKVALERPAVPLVESVTIVQDSLNTELLVEQKPANAEEATVSENEIHKAQFHQVQTTYLEPAVESSDDTQLEAASESIEPEIEKVGAVSIEQEESEVIQPPSVTANSPKAVVVNPIEATSEMVICTESVEVTELTVQTKEVKMEMEQLAATEENIPVKEIIQTVTEEMSSTFCGVFSETPTQQTEPAGPVVMPGEETVVITETRILVAPHTAKEKELEPEPVDDEPSQIQETEVEVAVEEIAEAPATESASTVVEKMEEIKSEIEAQSMLITKSVIQEAVDKVSDDAPEAQKPSTPTDTINGAAQATATIEKELDINTEAPIITDTPIPVVYEKPTVKSPKVLCAAMEVVDTIPIEVTGSLAEEEKEEKEEKPESVKKALEVKVGEEIVVEEVLEMKAESQTGEELKEVNEEETQKDQEPEVKETTEDVKSPSDENKDKELSVHMPVQVVLQRAQVVEDPTLEPEAAEEFGTNGHEATDTPVKSPSPKQGSKLSVLLEEPQASDEAETEAASTKKCAEVMAQVMEVIEEAVKEIEPVSTEITAAS